VNTEQQLVALQLQLSSNASTLLTLLVEPVALLVVFASAAAIAHCQQELQSRAARSLPATLQAK
jgi:hypothetical protein